MFTFCYIFQVFFLYTLAGISAYFSAWISIIMKVKGQRFEGNVTCYDFLPFQFQIPFPVETRSQCENVFTFMGAALCAFAWFIASECHGYLKKKENVAWLFKK